MRSKTLDINDPSYIMSSDNEESEYKLEIEEDEEKLSLNLTTDVGEDRSNCRVKFSTLLPREGGISNSRQLQ